jgi:hypothetical protein
VPNRLLSECRDVDDHEGEPFRPFRSYRTTFWL